MACFIVPGTEAVATAVVAKIIELHERKKDAKSGSGVLTKDAFGSAAEIKDISAAKRSASVSGKLRILSGMLFGGSVLLAFEHVWHGEVVPWFPFLTAAESPESTATMLREMGTVGVSMAILVTAVWAVMMAIADAKCRKPIPEKTAEGRSRI